MEAEMEKMKKEAKGDIAVAMETGEREMLSAGNIKRHMSIKRM